MRIAAERFMFLSSLLHDVVSLQREPAVPVHGISLGLIELFSSVSERIRDQAHRSAAFAEAASIPLVATMKLLITRDDSGRRSIATLPLRPTNGLPTGEDPKRIAAELWMRRLDSMSRFQGRQELSRGFMISCCCRRRFRDLTSRSVQVGGPWLFVPPSRV